MDIGDDWVDSEDESELGDYATENLPAEIVNKAERKQSQSVRIVPDQRKSSTGSQVHLHNRAKRFLNSHPNVTREVVRYKYFVVTIPV